MLSLVLSSVHLYMHRFAACEAMDFRPVALTQIASKGA